MGVDGIGGVLGAVAGLATAIVKGSGECRLRDDAGGTRHRQNCGGGSPSRLRATVMRWSSAYRLPSLELDDV